METIQKGSAQWNYLNSSTRRSRSNSATSFPRTPRAKAVTLFRPFCETDESSPEWDARCHSPTVEQAPFCSLDRRLIVEETSQASYRRGVSSMASSVVPSSSSHSDDEESLPDPMHFPSDVVASCLQGASRSMHALLVQPSEVEAMDAGPMQNLPSVRAALHYSIQIRTRGVQLLRRTLCSSLIVAAAVQVTGQFPGNRRMTRMLSFCQWLPMGIAATMGILHISSLRTLLGPSAPLTPSSVPRPPLYGLSCLTVVLTKVAMSCITEAVLSDGRVSSSTAALVYLRQRTLLEALNAFLKEVGGTFPFVGIPADKQSMVECITNAGGVVQSMLWFHSCRARPLSSSSSGRPWLLEQLRFFTSSLWLRRYRKAITTLHDQLRLHFIDPPPPVGSPMRRRSLSTTGGAYRELFLHAQRACGLLFALQSNGAGDGEHVDPAVRQDLNDAMERLSNAWYRHLVTNIPRNTHSPGRRRSSVCSRQASRQPSRANSPPPSPPGELDVLDATVQGVHPIPLYPKEAMDADEGAERGDLPQDFMAQLRKAAACRGDGGAVLAGGLGDDEVDEEYDAAE